VPSACVRRLVTVIGTENVPVPNMLTNVGVPAVRFTSMPGRPKMTSAAVPRRVRDPADPCRVADRSPLAVSVPATAGLQTTGPAGTGARVTVLANVTLQINAPRAACRGGAEPLGWSPVTPGSHAARRPSRTNVTGVPVGIVKARIEIIRGEGVGVIGGNGSSPE
jgi:hypothetical protein